MCADLTPVKKAAAVLEQARQASDGMSPEDALSYWDIIARAASTQWFSATENYLAEIRSQTMREASTHHTGPSVDDSGGR